MNNTTMRRLESLEIAVTPACNLRCRHCSAARECSDRTNPALTELRTTIAAAAALGATSLDLTGGEPTLRNDLEELIRIAKRSGICRAKVHTNGTLLGWNRLHRLRDAGLDALAVSLDGSTAEIHARTRRTTPDEFEQTLETIRMARALDMAVKVNTAVSTENIADVPRITALAAELGCYEHRLCLVAPAGRGAQWKSGIVKDVTWEQTLRTWPAAPIHVSIEIRRIPSRLIRTVGWECLLTSPRQLYINTDGSAAPCARMSFAGMALGSTRVTPLAQLWHDDAQWHHLASLVPQCCPNVGRTNRGFVGICQCRKISINALTPPRSCGGASCGIGLKTNSRGGVLTQ